MGDESFNTRITSSRCNRCREGDCVDADGRGRSRYGNRYKEYCRHCFLCLVSLVSGGYNALWVSAFVALVVVEMPNSLDLVSYKEKGREKS